VGDVVMPRYWVATTDRTWGIRINFIRPGIDVTDQYLRSVMTDETARKVEASAPCAA
jgi:hypothetical protein